MSRLNRKTRQRSTKFERLLMPMELQELSCKVIIHD